MPDPVTVSAALGWGVSAAGWLVSPIISRVLNKGFAHLDFDAPKKLKMLDIQVLELQSLIEVADESTYKVRLEPLLDKLKSALYEGEDILDDIEYQRLKKQIQDSKSDGSTMDSLKKNLRSAMPSCLLKDKGIDPGAGGGSPSETWRTRRHRSPASQRQPKSCKTKVELKKSLKNIESAISDAYKLLKQLKLTALSSDNGRPVVATNSHHAVTTAGPPPRVIGRDQDRDKIIAMFHENEDHCQATIVSGTYYSVIGIHGIAGSGKSTLAQYVYEHERKHRQEKMEGHFDIVMWIHVSQKFKLDSIFKEMFEGATGKACDNFNSLNVLKEKLEEEMRGKRILLVLDDVWYNIKNPRDHEELQKLISPLNVGKAGSRILVTSRTEAALFALGAVKERCIPISDLDDQAFLEMFMHYALRDARVSDHDRKILEMIGEDIAKKLKGSPLAARTVGSRLRETQTVEFWRSQKDRDLMNDTMGALWWSYQYLDEQVRRCFTYCSIFPRRHKLRRDELVKLWVAEGFIKTSKPNEEMEDVAQYYFDELLSSSFLQFGGKEKVYATGHDREVDYFTIHDLLCDLAEEVAGRDCFRIEEDFTGEVPPGVRYLFAGTCNMEMLIEKISGLRNLRTLIIDDKIDVTSDKHKAFKSMFAMFTRLTKLRVLKLSVIPYNDTFSFPDSIGDLKHLRYFAFWVYGMVKLTLPGTFTKLYHMQVADFGFCGSLTSSSGEHMINLINLRHVISKADLGFANVGRMIWLQTLPIFRIRRERGYGPHQLKHLSKLQGKLVIRGLENVESKEEAVQVNLAGKEKLTKLVLQWNNGSCSPEVQAQVLEGLCPSKYLERLEISQYHGMTLPSWMMGGHNGGPKNLQELMFIRCQLGPDSDLGAFIHLRYLHVYSCSWDALPGNMEHLTALKILTITYCKNMRLLPTLPKSLEEISIADCSLNALPGNIEHLTSLKKLYIQSCKNMRSLPTLPKSLEEITVRYCSDEFTQSCVTTDDPNWQKIEHIPKKTIEFNSEKATCPLVEDGR